MLESRLGVRPLRLCEFLNRLLVQPTTVWMTSQGRIPEKFFVTFLSIFLLCILAWTFVQPGELPEDVERAFPPLPIILCSADGSRLLARCRPSCGPFRARVPLIPPLSCRDPSAGSADGSRFGEADAARLWRRLAWLPAEIRVGRRPPRRFRRPVSPGCRRSRTCSSSTTGWPSTSSGCGRWSLRMTGWWWRCLRRRRWPRGRWVPGTCSVCARPRQR